MRLFNIFKKKPTEEKKIIAEKIEEKEIEEKNYDLPYFGKININNLEEYYNVNIDFNKSSINTDLNFKNKVIEGGGIEHIETFLKNIENFDKSNKVHIEKDFNKQNGQTLDYINFYLDELSENEIAGIIDVENQDIPKNVLLLKKLRLIRVGLYPDGKYGANYYATFDYSVDVDGEPCNQLLVVNTDGNGDLDHITWES